MSTDSIFNKKVTHYPTPTSTLGVNETLGVFLCRGLYCRQQIEAIRQTVLSLDQVLTQSNNCPDIQRMISEVENAKRQKKDKKTIKSLEGELKHIKQKANNWTDIKALEDHYKAQKRLLPSATISGVFTGGHSANNLVEHSGLICIDIDHCDTAVTMQTLRKMNIVAYASRSASGKGVFCIVPLAYPECHTEQFLALEKVFAEMGIYIDEACKDVSRLRFVSYDPQAFYRPDAVPFTGIWEASIDSTHTHPTTTTITSYHHIHAAPASSYSATGSGSHKDTYERAEACVSAFENGLSELPDLDYNKWCMIGMALSELGERGRDLFKRISRVDDKSVSENVLDAKYDNFLTTTRSIGIGSFFAFCKEYGVSGRTEMNDESTIPNTATSFSVSEGSIVGNPFSNITNVSKDTSTGFYTSKPLF